MASQADNADNLIHWRPGNGTRGTYDILSLCISTLFICAWSAVHVDIPKSRSFWNVHVKRVGWLVVGLFTPELLVYAALEQFREARKITALARERLPIRTAAPPPDSGKKPEKRDMPNDLESRLLDSSYASDEGERDEVATSIQAPGTKNLRRHQWTLTHSFYAIMGGFVAPSDSDTPQIVTTAELRLLMNANPERIPDISEFEIMDRSKTGALSKALLCIQIIFFCGNCIARLNQHLPLTLIEITSIAHALCALAAYGLWWCKPQDVGVRTPISGPIPTRLNPNFDTLLFDSSEGDERSITTIILLPALYGCPHLLALSVQFATNAEQNLWFLCTVLVISCPIVVVWDAILRLLVEERARLDMLRRVQSTRQSYPTQSSLSQHFEVDKDILSTDAISTLLKFSRWVLIATLVVYVVGSGYLVCESIRQVFALPDAAFKQPQWTRYFPHFS